MHSKLCAPPKKQVMTESRVAVLSNITRFERMVDMKDMKLEGFAGNRVHTNLHALDERYSSACFILSFFATAVPAKYECQQLH